MGLPAPATHSMTPVQGQPRTLRDWEPSPRVIEPGELEHIQAVCEPVSPAAAAWVQAYIASGNKSVAASLVGISPQTVRGWVKRHPNLATLLDSYMEEIRDRWNAVAEAKAMNGFHEWMYNGEGELKGTKVKQDPSFVRALLGSIDPDRWSSQDKPAQITVNVMQVVE